MRYCFFFILAFISVFNSLDSQEIIGTIISVRDGDSFKLQTSDSIYTIRLNGIDCPEINQPYGEEAQISLNLYLSETVVIIKKEVDKYGRTIADVFYKDTLLNFKLIEKGLAWHYKKYSSDTILAQMEIIARDQHIGLWSEEHQIAPWDWRSGNYDKSLLREDKTKVFVCISKDDPFYHHVHYCADLTKCTASIILVFPEEATRVYKKSKCSKCYK